MKWVMVVALLMVAPGAWAQSQCCSKFGALDGGFPYVERAMDNGVDCAADPVNWGIPLQTIADQAIWVSIGAESAVSTTLAEKGAAVSPSTDSHGAVYPQNVRCFPSGYSTFEDMETWTASVNALRRSGGAPIQLMLWHRFDTVIYPQLAIAGFKKEFLADTTRPWSEVIAFYSTDSNLVCSAYTDSATDDCQAGSPSCIASCGGNPCSEASNVAAGRCGYNFCYSSFKMQRTAATGGVDCHRPDRYLGALAGATSTTYQTKISYLPHSASYFGTTDAFGDRFPFATGYLANLSNTEYQDWEVARLSALWDVVKGWAHSFQLTWKVGQYMCREPWSADDAHSKAYHVVEQWIGGHGDADCVSGTTNRFDTHVAVLQSGNTAWSAQPTAYGWSEYVQGFRDITDKMRAAGVPYTIYGSLYPWWRSNGGWNDTGTCNGPARCACDYSVATGSARSDGWQAGDGTDMCDFYDDPSTKSVNENTEVIEIYLNARVLIIGDSSNGYDIAVNASNVVPTAISARGGSIIRPKNATYYPRVP